MHTFKDCPALRRIGAIVAFGPLWFYDEFDKAKMQKEKRTGDDDTYVPSESSVHSDSEEDDDDDSTSSTGITTETATSTATEGVTDSGSASGIYQNLYDTFHSGSHTKRLVPLHILSENGANALRQVGARLMELVEQQWPDLDAQD